ncbi:hypothetical protein ACHWQZ_G009906 [Mnemiopsis leidyi]
MHSALDLTDWRKDLSAGHSSKKTVPVYSQIDFILSQPSGKYRQALESTLSRVVPQVEPNEDLNNLLDSMKTAAVKSLGILKHSLRNGSDDDKVKELAYQRYLMRQLLSTNKSADRTL